MPCVLLVFTLLLLLWPAFAVAQTSCLLAWERPTTRVDGSALDTVHWYRVYRSPDNTFTTPLTYTLAGPDTSAALACVPEDFFHVTALECDDPAQMTTCRESAPSNVAQPQTPVEIQALPSPPSLVVILLTEVPPDTLPPPDPITLPQVYYYLLLSPHADRREPVALDGQVLSGTVYIFAERVVHLAFQEPPAITRVNFWLVPLPTTSSPYRTENGAPYDLGGGSATQADPWDTRTLPNGPHTISARFLLDDGTRQEVSATVMVAN
jgi:hypothetical protein